MEESTNKFTAGTVGDSLNQLEKELGLKKDFIVNLLKEDDWSYIIKLHALIEAAVTQLLIQILEKPELEKRFARLELSNLTIGKLAFLKDLNLLDDYYVKFIIQLSEIRNNFVHDVKRVECSLKEYFRYSPKSIVFLRSF